MTKTKRQLPLNGRRAVTPHDLKLDTAYEGLPTVQVEDGNIVEDNLREDRPDREWLLVQLARLGIGDVRLVSAAVLDTEGRFFARRK